MVKIVWKLTLDDIISGRYQRFLTDYKERIEKKTDNMLGILARAGQLVANVEFASAVYDGIDEGIQAQVIFDDRRHARIVASGETLLFIEFGTGVYFNSPHPKAAELGMIRGTFGKGKGANPAGWSYKGTRYNSRTAYVQKTFKSGEMLIHTRGNPANMPMQRAVNKIRRSMEEAWNYA